jgi:hypothetical protein
MSEAILRASSARNSGARFDSGEALLPGVFILLAFLPLPKGSRSAVDTPTIFHITTGIGNKSGGSGYRFHGVRSYSQEERNSSEGETMQKRKLRNLEVSAIGFGCMNMSCGYNPPADNNQGLPSFVRLSSTA